ncbi:2-oxoglutarate dehydrogenase E1 component [Sphingomonas nostoxanthinifaciens]|uniref:2-oxoglutarate dehydrogenase E1 component n=1 Tax=Sphingomonas nostoxanthinifaciens TaxID=2872652 RepID=UPI001CC1E568|nr:2-oxoglutarate dehydrogenase E1 component [Sphingomonas nostoxanthinifaciens]UAK25980.1 2-oxoglutarate dehydrogenase E1 component [Sphingomonas nostoxanthinifaciens]
MGFEGQSFDGLEGVSPSFAEALYRRYRADPQSVEAGWRAYFETLESSVAAPSWARPNWPPIETDALTAGLDPTQMQPEPKPAKGGAKPAPAAPAAAPAAADVTAAALDAIRAATLIRTYRVRGHLLADLDPLGLARREQLPEDLDPAYHGFTEADMDRPIFVGGALGFEKATVRELIAVLRRNYCGKVGLEYMHIQDVEERKFLQERMEGKDKEISFTLEGKKAILTKVIEGEQWEKFCARKFVGTKRFGLDGGESMIPALEAVLKYAGSSGVQEVVLGMAHRGRLNVLVNVMAKPYRILFHEFAGGSSNPEDVGGSGDVKYHLGTSSDREFDGHKIHLSLAPNPSHLECVDPVVLGKSRAKQTKLGDNAREKVLPILIHGDAAFAGQGVIMECFGFSGLVGYNTGGCIHFVINNQVGFTTSPQFARSSPYPSDIAKMVSAPILHVNGDDPEAVTFACKVATEYRQTFKRDVVIDMWCYRRFGHNESDEPGFTQPLMYDEIRTHTPVSKVYADRLIAQGQVDQAWVDQEEAAFIARLDDEFEAAKGYKANKADWFEGEWAGFAAPKEPITEKRAAASGVTRELADDVARTLTTVPEGLVIHKTLGRVLDAKRQMFASGEGIDWATAEALAFGTLLKDGYAIRLSGQDVGRGTFSQRHAVWVDQTDAHKYIPLSTIDRSFQVLDSPLSEFGVLGFEYGYSGQAPNTLVLWEAQFGDFANGAQVMIDQFIVAGEDKWLRANGLVMLLPHGYEGQGAEHSSARLERYLQLCAEDNIQVANCTTPANYFHILRRQMLRKFRKPLIIMTPKSLLRHKAAVSSLDDLLGDSHFHRILPDPTPPADDQVKRLVLCSGKVFYDLADAREKAGDANTSIIRVEQLYPFPSDALVARIARMPNLETVVWAQEEPRNAGAWFFVRELIEAVLADTGKSGIAPVYAGRKASPATATGLAKKHVQEQAALVAEALGHEAR